MRRIRRRATRYSHSRGQHVLLATLHDRHIENAARLALARGDFLELVVLLDEIEFRGLPPSNHPDWPAIRAAVLKRTQEAA